MKKQHKKVFFKAETSLYSSKITFSIVKNKECKHLQSECQITTTKFGRYRMVIGTAMAT